MAVDEFTFGGVHCAIETEALPSFRDTPYVASLYVIGDDAQLYPIRDSETCPVDLAAGTPSNLKQGAALEDIGVGSRGWIREARPRPGTPTSSLRRVQPLVPSAGRYSTS